MREVDSRRRPPGPPGHRSRHRALLQTLVEVGRKLIRTEGLDAVSLRAAATAAGVSTAAPYRHVANKHAPLASILLDDLEDLEDLRDLLVAPVDGGSKVERLGTLAHRFVDCPPPRVLARRYEQELTSRSWIETPGRSTAWRRPTVGPMRRSSGRRLVQSLRYARNLNEDRRTT